MDAILTRDQDSPKEFLGKVIVLKWLSVVSAEEEYCGLESTDECP